MPKAVNKVEYGGRTLIDISGDTVTAEGLKAGLTAHGANGELIVGTMQEKDPIYYGKVQSTQFNEWEVPNEILVDCDGYSQTEGDIIIVNFDISDAIKPSNRPFYSMNTLVVNGTTARQIYHRGSPVCLVEEGDDGYMFYEKQWSIIPGDTVTFRFDGTNYVIIAVDHDSKLTVCMQQGAFIDSSTGKMNIREASMLKHGSDGRISAGCMMYIQNYRAYTGTIDIYCEDNGKRYDLYKINSDGQSENVQSVPAGLLQIMFNGSDAYLLNQ